MGQGLLGFSPGQVTRLAQLGWQPTAKSWGALLPGGADGGGCQSRRPVAWGGGGVGWEARW
jgi:hypothetical protein